MNISSTSSSLNTDAALGKSAVHAAGEYDNAAGPLNTDAALGKSAPLKLNLNPEQLASCTACGMCLPHCPTYRVTGEEAASPRGRLALMSAVQKSGVAEPSFAAHMELCVLCRGCETACPAGVPFGHLMEQTREAIASKASRHKPSQAARWLRFGYKLLPHRRLLRSAVAMGAIAQRLRLVPKKLNLPAIPLRQSKLRSSGDPASDDNNTVWLFTGCIMDAAMRDIHHASQKVIEATGAKVGFPSNRANCCGSLHRHAGLADDAAKLARRIIQTFPGDTHILVNSAGCGAMLKDYGNILQTEEAHKFSARVKDIHEWLLEQLIKLSPVATEASPKPRVAILDPCHLRHAQGAHNSVREALQPFAEIAELDDQGMCCGAGGAYSFTHPEVAIAIRSRKIEAIQRSGATQVAAANPGCILHLQKPLQALGISIVHPVEIINDCL